MNKTFICSPLQKYLLITFYMPRILQVSSQRWRGAGTTSCPLSSWDLSQTVERETMVSKQIFSSLRAHRAPGLHAGGGAIKTQGPRQEPENKSQETMELWKPREASFQRKGSSAAKRSRRQEMCPPSNKKVKRSLAVSLEDWMGGKEAETACGDSSFKKFGYGRKK